jgi:hypothetical protein
MSKHNRISHPIYNLLPTEMDGWRRPRGFRRIIRRLP